MKNKTNDQLLQMLANATKTKYCAGGHTKAQLNENRMRAIEEEMRKRKMYLPSIDERLEIGIFNGEGSI